MPGGLSRLEALAARKRRDLARAQEAAPLAVVQRFARQQPPARDFLTALRTDGVAVIGEIKRASPAAGVISETVDVAGLARRCVAGGVQALAVWTDAAAFGGRPAMLRQARAAGPVPVLRKDIILSPYQVYESRAMGADAVLLIAALLEVPPLRELIALTRDLGMAAAVSVHREEDLEGALAAASPAVFIHNRDVETFAVDLATTLRFRPHIPPGVAVVSESGIATPDDVARLRGAVDAVVVGTALMLSPDPEGLVRRLLEVGRAH